MHPNNKIIEQLYGAFQIRDASMMAACYHPKASFRDPIFQLQGKEEISAMWTMLCERGSDLRIQYENVQADGNSGSAEWQARYTFSATGRLVENHITAHFKFEEGLIIDHVDEFDFYRWSRQALGFKGFLLGWSPFLRNKVQQNAKAALDSFRGG